MQSPLQCHQPIVTQSGVITECKFKISHPTPSSALGWTIWSPIGWFHTQFDPLMNIFAPQSDWPLSHYHHGVVKNQVTCVLRWGPFTCRRALCQFWLVPYCTKTVGKRDPEISSEMKMFAMTCEKETALHQKVKHSRCISNQPSQCVKIKSYFKLLISHEAEQ